MPWIDDIRCHRGLIRLMSITELATALREPCADPAIRTRVASELTIRAWLLAGGCRWPLLPERSTVELGWTAYGLGNSNQAALAGWLEAQFESRTYDFALEPALDADNFGLQFKDDLSVWRTAQGVVPYVSTSRGRLANCVLLPFALLPPVKTGAIEARGRDGFAFQELVQGLQDAYRALVGLDALGDREGLCVTFESVTDPGVPLRGRSLGLPVVIAAFIKSRFRSMPCLSVIASGCLDKRGAIDRERHDGVSLRRKANWMLRMGARCCILPDHDDLPIGIQKWPVGVALASHVERLLAVAEVAPGYASPRQVEKRFDEIGRGMRYGGITAQEAKNELIAITTHIKGKQGLLWQSLRLRGAGLLATAHCHLGNTDEAYRIANVAIVAGSGGFGDRRYLGEALVRQAVNLTDFGNYEKALSLCDSANKVAGTLNSYFDQLDLRLKATSTRAQALMFWGLIDVTKCQEALADAQMAVELAREYDGIDVADGERNVPRNLNYVGLWYALHDPIHAESVVRQYEAEIRTDHKNLSFYKRIRWLSAYRGLLGGKDVDWRSFEEDLPEENAEGGWLYMLSLKYRGALRAFSGDVSGARDDFSKAARLIDKYDQMPMLAFLGATVALQAGESLISAENELAIQYLAKSKDGFGKMIDWFTAKEINASQWLARADGLLGGLPITTLPNPQKYYPY